MKLSHILIASGSAVLWLGAPSMAQVTKVKPVPRDVKPDENTAGQTPIKVPRRQPGGNIGPSGGPTQLNVGALINIEPGSMSRKSQQILKICRYDWQLEAYKRIADYDGPYSGETNRVDERLVLTGTTSKADAYHIDSYVASRRMGDHDNAKDLEAVTLYSKEGIKNSVEVHYREGSASINVPQRTMDWVTKSVDEKKGVCVGIGHTLGAYMSGSSRLTPETSEAYVWTGSECRCR